MRDFLAYRQVVDVVSGDRGGGKMEWTRYFQILPYVVIVIVKSSAGGVYYTDLP